MKKFLEELKELWHKVVAKLSSIGKDKYLHFFVGVIIGFIPCLWKEAIILSIPVALFAGLLKEVYDFVRGGDFDWKDCLATFLGGLFVLIQSVLLLWAWS